MERITQHKSRGLSAILGMATSVFLPGISSSLANAIGRSLDLGAFAIRATTAALSALGTAAVAKIAGGDTSQIIAAGFGGAIAGGGVDVANEAVSRVFSPASISPALAGVGVSLDSGGSGASPRYEGRIAGRGVGRDRTLADATTGEITPSTALDVAASSGGAGVSVPGSAGLTEAQSNVYAALLSTAFGPGEGEGLTGTQRDLRDRLRRDEERNNETRNIQLGLSRTLLRQVEDPSNVAIRAGKEAKLATAGVLREIRGPANERSRLEAERRRTKLAGSLAGVKEFNNAFFRARQDRRGQQLAAINVLPSQSVNPALEGLSAYAVLDEKERKKQQKILGDTFSDSLV